MTSQHSYDVLIIGGGMVGASLACALQGLPLRVALIEAVPFRSAAQPSYDDRSIALAYGSRRIFEGMGLWSALQSLATPIQHIHVSDRGHFGFTRLAARRQGYAAFGYVVENRLLGGLFATHLPEIANLDVWCPARLEALELSDTAARVTLECDGSRQTLQAALVVGADGGQSLVRDQAAVPVYRHDYGQTAVIANVTPERDHGGTAYERFTRSGPLALLPMSAGRCSLVWTLDHAQVDEVMALPDSDFLARLGERFGRRLGRFVRVGKRTAYPLQLLRAQRPPSPRLALVGNAAHTLHPVAGQGFNLGIRDVAVLAEVISDALAQGHDPGSARVLGAYERWRKRDQRQTTMLTDSLVRLFSNDHAPLVLARNTGLVALDMLPPLKRMMTRTTMGLAGHLPRLARGLPLVPSR